MPTKQKNGKDVREPYLVTVVTEHYVEVLASSEEHAREVMQRGLSTEFGSTRSPRVTEIERID